MKTTAQIPTGRTEQDMDADRDLPSEAKPLSPLTNLYSSLEPGKLRLPGATQPQVWL